MKLGQRLKMIRLSHSLVTRDGWLYDSREDLERVYKSIWAYYAIRSEHSAGVGVYPINFNYKHGRTPSEWMEWLHDRGEWIVRNNSIPYINRKYSGTHRLEKFLGAMAGRVDVVGIAHSTKTRPGRNKTKRPRRKDG